MKRKKYLGPAIVLGIYLFLQVGLTIVSYIYLSRRNQIPAVNIYAYLPVMLCGIEALAYFFIRYRVYNRALAWWHVWILVGVPIVFWWGVYGILLRFTTKSQWQTVRHVLEVLSNVITLAAHMFFVVVLVQAFRKQPKPAVVENSPHLLDELVDDPSVNLR